MDQLQDEAHNNPVLTNSQRCFLVIFQLDSRDFTIFLFKNKYALLFFRWKKKISMLMANKSYNYNKLKFYACIKNK